jgi:plasmid stabilization system protein ParE
VKSKPVEALPEVAADLLAAIKHYESWRADGRGHLLQKYEETVSWIAWNPELFPRKLGAVQRVVLKQSYYIVYFMQETGRSIVLAVLDGRDDPEKRSQLVRRRRRSRSDG